MHVKDIKAMFPRVTGFAVKAGGFIRCHKRASIAVATALLLVGLLLLTGDDHVDVDVDASAQMCYGGLDRSQSRREVVLFVEGGYDDGELHGRSTHQGDTTKESVR